MLGTLLVWIDERCDSQQIGTYKFHCAGNVYSYYFWGVEGLVKHEKLEGKIRKKGRSMHMMEAKKACEFNLLPDFQ